MVATVQNNKPTTVTSVNLIHMRPLKCSLSYIIIEIRTQSVNSINGKKDCHVRNWTVSALAASFGTVYLNG